jgi:hypothetical protein
LELMIEKRDTAELNQMEIPVGAHWSPLELENENGCNDELIQMVIDTVLTLRKSSSNEMADPLIQLVAHSQCTG